MIYKLLFEYGLAFTGLLLISYLVGKICLSFFEKTQPQTSFLSLLSEVLSGTIILVFGYSMLKTGGNTINSTFIVLAALYFYFNRSEIKLNSIKEAAAGFAPSLLAVSFAKILGVSLPFFLYGAFYTLDASSSSGFAFPENLDFVYYAKLSEYIALTGNENQFQVQGLIDADFSNNRPYHYFELWINAFASNIFGLLHWPSLSLIAYPFAQSLFCIGILAVFQVYKKEIGVLEIVFSFALTAFKGIYIADFLQEIGFLCRNIFDMPKTGFVYALLMAAAAFFLHGNRSKAAFVLLMLPVVYSTVAPAVFSGISAVSLVIWVFKKEHRIVTGPILISAVVSAAYILLFYIFNTYSDDIGNIVSEPLAPVAVFVYLKTSVNIAGASVLQIAYMFALLLPVFAFQTWKKTMANPFSENLFVLSVYAFGVFAFGLFTWASLYRLVDGVQLFQNIGIPAINVLGICLSVFVLSIPAKKVLYMVVCLWMSVNTFYVLRPIFQVGEGSKPPYFSNRYVAAIDSTLEGVQNLNPVGISLYDSLDYVERDPYYSIPVNFSIYTLGAQLKLIRNLFNTVCLSPYSIPKEIGGLRESAIKTSLFYRYIERKKKEGRFIDIPQCQTDFIDEYGIGYLIVTKNVKLHPLLQARVKHQITDSLSGEKFILLSKKTVDMPK